MEHSKMKKNMQMLLLISFLLFGGIFIFKIVTYFVIQYFMAHSPPPVVSVSTMKVEESPWQQIVVASGSLRAIRGVNVTAELASIVQKIHFTPGSFVKVGTPLIQLNADNDIALLHSLEANRELAKITHARDKAQYAVHAISKQTLDADAANVKSLEAQVAQQAAIVAKKTIRAPFTGRLGINVINLGQFINPGDTIVMLQTVDPIYADFYVPQQFLPKLKVGQMVTASADSFPDKTFTGKITTINPGVDTGTRNVQVEATMANPHAELAPGMFVSVEANIGQTKSYLTLPKTAISFNPYGEIVFIVQEKGKDKKGHPILVANQAFIVTGESRGDQVSILRGLNKGDIVVTSGQLKLKNNSFVSINNSVVPNNKEKPQVRNEH